jgi:hypothetical protein
MKEIVCRDCKIDFNPDSPLEVGRAFYNQCTECQELAGIQDVGKVKAIVHTTGEGDFTGIEVMSAEKFEKYQRVVEETAGIGKERG